MKNADAPAAPVKPAIVQGNHQVHLGLTKREAAAIAAMQGLLADPNYCGAWDLLSRDAVEVADALFKELDK